MPAPFFVPGGGVRVRALAAQCENRTVELRPAAENPALRIVNVDGLDLAVWEWPGAGPPLIFTHATGFHGRLWDYIIRRLPGRRCLAVETRGHGRSARPDPPYRWRYLGKDLAGILRSFGVRGAFGIGHSSGGHSMVQAAALGPGSFRRHAADRSHHFPRGPLRRRAARFRLHPAPQERLALAGGDDRALPRPPPVRHLAAGDSARLLPVRAGCPTAIIWSWPARRPPKLPSTRNPSPRNRTFTPRLPRSLCRSPSCAPELPASPASSTWPLAHRADLAARFARGRDVVLEGASHFIPMEVPEPGDRRSAPHVWGRLTSSCGAG